MEGLLDEDAFAGFDITDEVEAKAKARRDRIEASRKASQNYQAKIEEAGWYDPSSSNATPSTSKEQPRADLYLLNSLYRAKKYDETLKKGLGMLKGKKKEKAGVADEVELLDLVLRASLKVDLNGSSEEAQDLREEVVAMARRYKAYCKSSAGLSYTSGLVLQSLLSSPSSSISPFEPLSASLSALSIHPTPTPYIHLLISSLRPISPNLAEVINSKLATSGESSPPEWEEREVDELETGGLDGDLKEVLKKILRMGKEREKEEEEGVGRDVRSL